MVREAVLGPFVLSLQVAGLSTALLLPIAFGLATYLKRRARFSGPLELLVQSPLVLPPVVVGYILLVALGPQSPVGQAVEFVFGAPLAFSFAGAVIVGMVVGTPFFVKSIQQALETRSAEFEITLFGLGISAGWQLAVLSLVQARRGILNGALLAFARIFGEFGATMMFASNIPGETQTVPLAIYASGESPTGDARIYLLCGLCVVVCIACVGISRQLTVARAADHER